MTRLPEVKCFPSSTGVRIYRIACDAIPDLSGRVYLLLGAGPPTLVDAGSGEGDSTPHILAGLDAVARRFGEAFAARDLGRILITHSHFDHVGGLAELAGFSGAEVWVHSLERRRITAWDERATLANHALRTFVRRAGLPESRHEELVRAFGLELGRVKPAAVHRVLADGDRFDGLEVIHTPGHAPGHICIRSGNVLLCGDHVLARTISQQWPEALEPSNGLGHYLDSLDKIERVEGIEVALGGHEPPIYDLAMRIEEIRATHLRRLERLMGILRHAPRPLSIHELTDRMYSNQRGFFELLALTDVGARVEYLDQRGELALSNLAEVARDPDVPHLYRTA
jgi:glyoxylase-like metal-dependent hydrolase (beta-lactamase superfamily II)